MAGVIAAIFSEEFCRSTYAFLEIGFSVVASETSSWSCIFVFYQHLYARVLWWISIFLAQKGKKKLTAQLFLFMSIAFMQLIYLAIYDILSICDYVYCRHINICMLVDIDMQCLISRFSFCSPLKPNYVCMPEIKRYTKAICLILTHG